MRILVDSAELPAIEAALAGGIISGVTTNPTLLRRAGLRADDVPALARAVIAAGAQEVHLQSQATGAEAMVRDGLELAAIDPARIRVKLVATTEGYRAAARLAREGVRVTLTAVSTLRQALAAQSVGAAAVAVYVGRLREGGVDPMQLIGRMQAMLDAQRAGVEILAASIRDPKELVELALQGVASATVAPVIIEQLLDSEATAAAANAFAADVAALVGPVEAGGEADQGREHASIGREGGSHG